MRHRNFPCRNNGLPAGRREGEPEFVHSTTANREWRAFHAALRAPEPVRALSSALGQKPVEPAALDARPGRVRASPAAAQH